MSAYEADIKKSQLKRVLGKWSLTAIGIGAIIGGGIFVLTGTGAYYHAGPALALSFVIAGIACVFAALCYSEFASILPVEGSAYAYAYGTIGEIFAWIIGWGLILEYAMGSMTVAVAWSGYFNKLLKMFGLHLPDFLTSDPFSYAGEGAFFILPENWTPFIPAPEMVKDGDVLKEAYGWKGIISGAAAIFFAYVGFDAVSTQAGMMHYSDFNPQGDYPDAIKAPVAYAFEIASKSQTGISHAITSGAGYIITIAATVGEAHFAASNTNIATVGNTVWIATGGKTSRIFKFTWDKPFHWDVFGTPFVGGVSSSGIYSIDFYNEKLGIAVGGDYTKQKENVNNIAVTSDGGETWQSVASGKNSGYKTCVKYRPDSGGKEIIAVGDGDISFSDDFGKTWKVISEEKNLFVVEWVDKDNLVFAGKNRILKAKFK
ncbi:hypothetical protein Lal_00014602 [Lupinus albus]|nr:hypothetical protein Lal_00014602 [Lupinus albus]